MTYVKHLITSFLLTISILSCGYSLRGSDSISANLSEMQLELQQPNSEFSRLLKRSLESAGATVELVTSEFSNDKPLLRVSNEQVISRPVTVNARSRAAQYELRMSITVAMGINGGYLIPPETLVQQKIYFEDIENISGNREEVEIISAEMRRELVAQLIRRIESVEI